MDPTCRIRPGSPTRRAVLTVAMWRCDGQELPESNLHGSAATAAIMRLCFNSAGYRVGLPPAVWG
jgi:hypothetical protein